MDTATAGVHLKEDSVGAERQVQLALGVLLCRRLVTEGEQTALDCCVQR